ncbi:acyloxyacyl hydrolase [Parasphingorhabdus halotolerans]|uniref:Acyloxyacyl hydrolase n=1 Tax=Parasphingorhabdus halotolerans TaxID=2725558 RepID=A0A6H2DNY6_9SPHN|nr:acyloxyacyl hydrolase [Parasphingorhabdus halotolerans]QJB70100.1 acyloxyacyl hydrolase [Parasphingorhabdus halotolerans]
MGLAIASPTKANEIFDGIASQEIATPVAQDTGAEGVDFQFGYRGNRIDGLSFIGKPSPYILGSINSAGSTSFAAAGLSWKIGDKIYARPAIGIAIHDGPELEFAPDGSQTQLGSRVLFAPELALGVRLSQRVDLEASWVHLSHARIFSSVQNPGLDSIGMRLVVKLP